MKRDYYSAPIPTFLATSSSDILGTIWKSSGGSVTEHTQRDAWQEQITILKRVLRDIEGMLYFEYSIPRMGRRIDNVLLIGPALFVLEFKIGEKEFTSCALNQAYDYALDLKNFHETSLDLLIAPIVIATKAPATTPAIAMTVHNDKVLEPIRCNVESFGETLRRVLDFAYLAGEVLPG